MNDTHIFKKDKNQHIQVFVRVRPINSKEKVGKSSIVVEVPTSKEILVHERPHDKFSKKFTFDKVFGPLSKQIDVYNVVVSPLLEEVLAGYNCTVFAYGQTGTGKTFTMEGVSPDPNLHWQTDTDAGVIPRALSHMFDELCLLEGQEYTVRVSFLELYNEEIFDLLSPNVDLSKIRLYEDTTKKGAVIVHGLEEVTVHSKSEVYKILEKGSEKRQTAATLMNAHSSRSHTVFSITVHIRENTVDGEELLKTGKLNLVDLAGSENIGRSGAVDRRAREAGNINQSLLTLGRVITALVERAPHIPYRESKLTRLLQESLGGRTKTSIIATISPASVNLEETLSTLDYAHRAKNITNRPEINQKLSKKALLQEYTEEIERLRRDLLATRERNGVYLAQDSYMQMQTLIDHQAKEIEEKLNHIKVLQETMDHKEQLFNELQSKHIKQECDLLNTKNELDVTEKNLMSTVTRLKVVKNERDEQKHLVKKHFSTEKTLLTESQTLLDVVNTVTSDVCKLHEKVDRQNQVENINKNIEQRFESNTMKCIEDIETNISKQTQNLTEFYASINEQLDAESKLHHKAINELVQYNSQTMNDSEKGASTKLTGNVDEIYSKYQNWLTKEVVNATNITDEEINMLSDISLKLAPKIHSLIENKIAENLHILNNSVSKKLDDLSDHAKNSINAIYTNGLKERDDLLNNIGEIKKDIKHVLQNQTNVMNKRYDFEKTLNEVQVQFNDLHKEGESNNSVINDTMEHMDHMCENMNTQVLNSNSIKAEQSKGLEGRILGDVQIVKTCVSNKTEKIRSLIEETVAQGNALLNELQTELANICNKLEKYKNCKQQNTDEMLTKMESNKSVILESIQEMHTLVTDASNNYVKCSEIHKLADTNMSIEVCNKLATENENIKITNERIIKQLHDLQSHVEKFLKEDIQRDVPTGTTPMKKDFQYPRELNRTSPHERIIKRLREARKSSETFKDITVPVLNKNTSVEFTSEEN